MSTNLQFGVNLNNREPLIAPDYDLDMLLDLSEIVEELDRTSKLDMPGRIAGWLDALNENGRWALLKLMTGALRVGLSVALFAFILFSHWMGWIQPTGVPLGK